MLRNKTAVVTGANRGIGKTILEKFAEQGADIYACARTPRETFEEELNAIAKKYSVNVMPVYFDMASETEIKEGAKYIISQKRKIDILVNNAGIASTASLHMLKMDELQKVYKVNFMHQLYLIQLLTKYMIRNKAGSVVNIGSVAGIDNREGTLAYGGSKSSLVWSTKTLALELGRYNVRVNTVAPGFIQTDMLSNLAEDVKQKRLEASCLKRVGTPDDVANAVLFLASDMAAYITGQTLRVDGGRI